MHSGTECRVHLEVTWFSVCRAFDFRYATELVIVTHHTMIVRPSRKRRQWHSRLTIKIREGVAHKSQRGGLIDAMLSISSWPPTALGQGQKPECASGKARGRRGLGR